MINKYYFLEGFRAIYKDKKLKKNVVEIENAMIKISDISRGILNRTSSITFFVLDNNHDVVMKINPNSFVIENEQIKDFWDTAGIYDEFRVFKDKDNKARLIVEFVFKDVFE